MGSLAKKWMWPGFGRRCTRVPRSGGLRPSARDDGFVAKAGKVILITDRGQPVARPVPLTRTENARNKLIDDGQLIPTAAPRGHFSTDDLVSGPPLTPILDEQRSER
jgi:hypothetical protein